MTLALHGGPPVRRERFPPPPPYGVDECERAYKVIASGELSGFVADKANFLGGPCVQSLERAVCERFGVKYAVTMNSATSCLYGAVQALVVPGDEVIVTPWSMSASVACALEGQAYPVFADIESETYGLDATAVARAITPRTKAIVLVDLFGCVPRDAAEIVSYGIPVIEDAAQAIGARDDAALAGTLGDVGVFSFNRHKTLQCGEGGVAITNNDGIAEFLRGYRNHGEVLGYRRGHWGGNYRMGEVYAAIAEVQLGRLEELTDPRAYHAQRITDALLQLTDLPESALPIPPGGWQHVYHVYSFRVGSAAKFARALCAEGVPASQYVKPLYQIPAFRACSRRDSSDYWRDWYYPEVERAYREVVLLPHVHAGMTDVDVDDVIQAICKVHAHRNEL